MSTQDARLGTHFSTASWGSVIGGVVTIIAVLFIFSLLGTALGFGMLDPQSNDPMDGIGTAFSIWSAVTLLVSLALGGFVAGRLAGRTGFSHGFLAWATAVILAALFSAMAVTSATKLAGSAIGSVFSAAGSAVSSVASVTGEGVSRLADQLSGQFDMSDTDIDGQQVQQSTLDALRDTDARTLQPEYLRQQAREAGDDATDALYQLRANPDNYQEIIQGLLTDLRGRAETIAQGVDRDAAINALTENTDMSREEAEQTADQLISQYERTVETVEYQLDRAQERLNQAQQELEQLADQAREQAAAASNAVAKSALWAAIALLIGALVSGGAGLLGSKSRAREERRIV